MLNIYNDKAHQYILAQVQEVYDIIQHAVITLVFHSKRIQYVQLFITMEECFFVELCSKLTVQKASLIITTGFAYCRTTLLQCSHNMRDYSSGDLATRQSESALLCDLCDLQTITYRTLYRVCDSENYTGGYRRYLLYLIQPQMCPRCAIQPQMCNFQIFSVTPYPKDIQYSKQ